MSWDSFILGDVIDLNYGKGLPSRKRIEGGIPVYGSGGVVGFHKKPFVSGPGIIVGRKGTVGSVYWENNDFFPIDTVYYVSKKKDYDDFRFIYYLLKSLPLSTLNTDAAVPGLNRENALRYRVQIPSPEKQKEIAAILSAYDNLIENNSRRIQLLEESARLIYREWFVRLRFPGHEHVKIIDGVPEGWEKKKIAEVTDTYGGGTPSTKVSEYWVGGNITWFIPKDLTNNDCLVLLDSEKKITEEGLKKSSAKMLPPEAILMTSRASIGYFGLYDGAEIAGVVKALAPEDAICDT